MRYRLALLVIGLLLLTPISAAQADSGTDVGVVDGSTGRWYLLHEHPDGGDGVTSFYFGNPGDVPFVGDWDCDGVDTPGLYRQSDGYVYLRNSNTQGVADFSFFFGDRGDVPIAGDFDGDGCDTVSVYRPTEGRAFIINELGENGGGLGVADYAYDYGNPLDVPFVGDFDNDGVDTLGLHRRSTGQVFLRNSNSQGIADLSFYYGNPGDLITAGSWRVDPNRAGDTVGIYRPGDRTIYLRFSNSPGSADWMSLFGNPDARPVAGVFGDLPGNDDWPDLQAHFNAVPVQDSSGQCGVHLTWDWDGPIWAMVSLSHLGGHLPPIEEFSQLVDPDGSLDSYTYTFSEQRGGRVGAAIYAGGSASGRFIDGVNFVMTEDCQLQVDP